MSDWKEQASQAHAERPAGEGDRRAGSLSRPEARDWVRARLAELGIAGDVAEELDDHSHLEVDGIIWYVGPGGELWGRATTTDGEHSWDMPIRSLADAGELLAHHADIEAGIHPEPRPVPLAAEVQIGEAPDGE